MDFAGYARTFQYTMWQRAEALQSNLRKKRQLDAKKELFGEDAAALIALIGEDTMFTSGQKRRQQTIRHQIWKFRKSIEFFSKHQNEVYQLLARQNIREPVVVTLAPTAAAEAHVLLSELEELERVYARQALILSHYRLGKPFAVQTTYQTLVEREKAIWNKIRGRENQVNYLIHETRTHLQRNYEEAKNVKVDALALLKNTCLVITSFSLASASFIIFLLGGLMDNNGDAGDDVTATLLILGGLLGCALSTIPGSYVNEQPFTDAWDRCNKIIKEITGHLAEERRV